MADKRRGWREPMPSEITPRAVYLARRRILRAALIGGLTLPLAGLIRRADAAEGAAAAGAAPPITPPPGKLARLDGVAASPLSTGETLTAYDSATGYNNFYEFGPGKEDPARNAGTLKPRPWTLTIEGLCGRPGTYDVDDLIRANRLEERIYRLRCVEAWSMVLPWVGIPFADIIKRAEPAGSARYVAFRTLHDPARMPGQRYPLLDWPYVEGLRLDEAMHPLTLIAVGLYGEVLPNQNGAPARLVVPWKYGFKSIKSIVAIRFVEQMPPTSWNRQAPDEYGFYANVNPAVDHPRWSQKRERRIGEFLRRDTLPFNGYADQVAPLYAGMDLAKWF